MNFIDEIKNYSIDDLELIIETQKDLYSDEELSIMKSMVKNKKIEEDLELQEKIKSCLPSTIICEKCDAPNNFENDICEFCEAKIEKSKYYSKEYFEQQEDVTFDDSKSSYTFHYLAAILIPLIGFITGAIMIANDDDEKRFCGKTCIILGVVSIVLSTIIISVMLWAHPLVMYINTIRG